MISIKELKKSKEYWQELIQNNLYADISDYMLEKEINKTELAEELGCSKGYVSQILNGNFNFSINKYIELALATNHYPVIGFKKQEQIINSEKGKVIKLNVAKKKVKKQQILKNVI